MNKSFCIVLVALAAAFGCMADPVTKTRLGSLNPREGLVVTDVDLSGIGGGDYLPKSWATNDDVVLGPYNTILSNKHATAIGHNNTATGEYSIAIGDYASAASQFSLSVGTSDALGKRSGAIGYNNWANADDSFAIGLMSSAYFPYSFAMGYGAVASNNFAYGIGPFANAKGAQSIAVGGQALASGEKSLAFGSFSKATNAYAIAIGAQAVAAEGGVAIGYDAEAAGGGFASGLGWQVKPGNLFYQILGSKARGRYSIALGGTVDTMGFGSVSLGTWTGVAHSNAVVIGAGKPQNVAFYTSHGVGTITLGVEGGLEKVWIGGTNMADHVAAAIRNESLGGIWDSQLEVWWTPIMENGALKYVATTNVNMGVGQ